MIQIDHVGIYGHKKRQSHFHVTVFLAVVPPGIEPGTQGFSVLCSTN